jgi:5-methyltetrahydrofolate--homocysteine methyltransferase
LVVGCIDEDKAAGAGFHARAEAPDCPALFPNPHEKYGIPAEDIVIDPLVFPCATGDANYIGGAVETIEGIRLIKENIPYVKTAPGISNISWKRPQNS